MKNLFNKAAHFLIGFICGYHAEKPASRTGAMAFLGYQGIEAYRKGDDGYVEVKEWAFGFGAGLIVREVRRRGLGRRLGDWLAGRQPSEPHTNPDLANWDDDVIATIRKYDGNN